MLEDTSESGTTVTIGSMSAQEEEPYGLGLGIEQEQVDLVDVYLYFA